MLRYAISALLLVITPCQAENLQCTGTLKRHHKAEPLTATVVTDGTSIVWRGVRAELLCDETLKDPNCDFRSDGYSGFINRLSGRARVHEDEADLDLKCLSVRALLCDPRDGPCGIF
jgi:hypothetical protein